MKLTDLQPVWIYKRKVFAFLCPHCRTTWLTCKNVVMNHSMQRQVIDAHFGEDLGHEVVGCRDGQAWKTSGDDFEAMTVQPSLDASKSGHWHGHITAGNIVGGI